MSEQVNYESQFWNQLEWISIDCGASCGYPNSYDDMVQCDSKNIWSGFIITVQV